LQKFAICSNDKAVFSTSQTAVPFGISGCDDMIILLAPHPTGGGAYGAIEDDRNGAYIGSPLAAAQPPFGSLRRMPPGPAAV
jgi:hypothetical protein